MVYEIALPVIGAGVTAAVYAIKADKKTLEHLNDSYSQVIERNDLKKDSIQHYMQELGQFKGGILTWKRKRFFEKNLKHMLFVKESEEAGKRGQEMLENLPEGPLKYYLASK